MSGTLYGIGVGPGDPELLTLKAIRTIKESDIIAVPREQKEQSVAYQIVKQVIEDIDEKLILPIYMPMTKDRQQLQKSHQKGAEKIIEYLEQGKKVAFLTLGDPTIYSTYLYLHRLIEDRGYKTEIVSGVPSFCAVSARLNQGLVENKEQLHIIPSSYDLRDSLHLPGTKILMKAGKKLGAVKAQLAQLDSQVYMIENCGMENEKIYKSIEEIKEDAGYYSLIIVKEK